MRVKIEISVSPEGFGSANLLAREANIGVPELVDFSPGERLSADDVGLLTRKLMDAVASTVAGVRDDLLILMELARNADGGDRDEDVVDDVVESILPGLPGTPPAADRPAVADPLPEPAVHDDDGPTPF